MGRGVFVPEWEVEVTPGGPKTILHGTVEEVHKKLVKLNPNWDEEFFNTTASELSELGSGFELFTRDFQDIPDFAKDWDAPRSYCGGPWGEASVERILDGIGYLERWPGKPKNGPGPGNCGRVSCSWNSAIWWCNDVLEAL
ncbi:hypothetical protein NW762_011644 [Fusarium torreyae]|uniref:Uncharacterized protein n=1 Tax=Fusarium torreyae TaxID=1237075 RepID=A0A9W8VC42_9HYPO|nr:hypothetical protein NW762_011644 [Fusarium torreyae]